MSNITKRALEDSLKHLLLKKPVNKITINDITEDCGVNRATFYYHFQDIYALIEWSCEEDSRKALSDNTTYDTWQQGFLNILHAVEDNKPFGIIHLIDNVDGSYISVSLTQDQYVFQIILCGLMTFFHVAPPYKENSKTIAPYAGRSNSIY